jgi:hypothetical protein
MIDIVVTFNPMKILFLILIKKLMYIVAIIYLFTLIHLVLYSNFYSTNLYPLAKKYKFAPYCIYLRYLIAPLRHPLPSIHSLVLHKTE